MGEQVDRAEAIAYVRSLDGKAVIEERLLGEEFTLQAFVDGRTWYPCPSCRTTSGRLRGMSGPTPGGWGRIPCRTTCCPS